MHISQLEALICVVAARTFLREHRDLSVCVICDNQAVATLSSGKGRDPVITAISRTFWYLSASQNINFTFRHAPGSTMIVADALSRQFLSQADLAITRNIVKEHILEYVDVISNACNFDKFY